MTDLLVTVILAVCPIPADVSTNACMENINNCAVQRAGKITDESITTCVEKETGVKIRISDFK